MNILNHPTRKLLSLLSFVCFACIISNAQTYVSGIINSNTTWTKVNSPYIVTGSISILQGDTLTIQPGIIVKFDNNYDINNQGILIATGTSIDSIIFTSNSNSPYAGIYAGIELNATGSGLFRYCRFSYAANGIEVMALSHGYPLAHCTFTSNTNAIYEWNTIANSPSIDSCIFKYDSTGINMLMTGETVSRCIFTKNGTGIKDNQGASVLNCTFNDNITGLSEAGGGAVTNCYFDSNHTALSALSNTVSHNTFKYNGTGITSTFSNITQNIVSDNSIGIETNQDQLISCNTICSNTTYNMVSNSKQNENVSNNYWCLSDSIHIQPTIYDTYQNPNVGFLYFTPIDTIACSQLCNISVYPPSICYVTTDTSAKFNSVIWQKMGLDTLAMDSIIVYRQDVLGNYVHIGAVSVHSHTEFKDYTAQPLVEPSFYELGILDTCGLSANVSNFNETIFLQSSVAVGPNAVNLNWNFYQGNPVVYYRILRDDSGKGNWHAIDSVQGSINAFTDRYAPVNPKLRYIISTDWNVSCTPFLSQHPLGNRYTFSSTEAYSNMSYVYPNPTGVSTIYNGNSVTIYPNPANSTISISIDKPFDGTVSITNVLGQEVYNNLHFTSEKGNTQQIDISNLSNGLYIVTFQSANLMVRKKIVKD